ncbi:BrnT family toxin [Shewanella sp. VB17]|uniref:BrnT family toxin n=1 Tax=Shewanella sp. VB17 TaxID=2739432 RepID=UPI0015651EBD|nr:BrnT family toxin [Shewanella sp. VB17]NRD73943.1 BrnT family toxin [Shewanella sp. VB17]
MVDFEFDEVKSNSNLEKHGVDFNVAKLLWNDPDLIEIPVNTHDEPRYIVIAMLNGVVAQISTLNAATQGVSPN